MAEIDRIQRFWEQNPLWMGESRHPLGSQEFFEEHRSTYIKDCFAGYLDDRIMPPSENRDEVLDLGCGPGFWTVELLLRDAVDKIIAADLTEKALVLTRQRLAIYGVLAETRRENAEDLSFGNGQFGHVNCQGVIHHTPNTERAVAEIARVLRPGGTASISVYYRNVILRNWHFLKSIGKVLHRMGAGLSGRGREGLMRLTDADEIVRRYDGLENPVGKAYTRPQFYSLLAPHFEVQEIFFHFFPARALPFSIPGKLHRFVDRRLPFMVFASVRKR